MEEHMLRRAQQSGGSKTFQTSNAETSTQHGSFEQEQSRACRQEDGAGGPPWCWWGNCGQRPRSTTMALPLHFGAKAQSHVGSTHDPHCDTQTEEKVGQGCSPSRGKLGRGATSAPCPLEIRQSFHTVLINWVGQEQYRFSLSFVSKIQGCNV